jgi:C4-dicarboxylate-specific signal transduction histidine kinase
MNEGALQKLTQELADAQWNAILGTVAIRLTHDFNNLLTGILSLSDAYMFRLPADNPAREGFQVIARNARQAAEIVQQLGALSRETPGQRSYQNLGDVVSQIAGMLGKVLPKHSAINVELKQASVPVYVDAPQLKQIIASLVLALQPPIHLTVALERNEALLKISGTAVENPRAAIIAETLAERNGANFVARENGYLLRLPEATFSELDTKAKS